MNFTRCSGVADESKKKDLKVNVSNFETCTRYFGVAGEKQKSKKSQGAICLFKLSKGGDLKKEFRKPWFKLKFEFSKIFN